MKRILHVIPSISRSWGGTSYALRNVLHVERLAGLETTVLACESPDSIRDELEAIEVLEMRRSFPSRFHRSTEAYRWLRDHVSEFDHVAIHCIWSFLPIDAASIARRKGAPYSVRPHGSLDPVDLQKKATAKRLLGPLLVSPMLGRAEYILSASQAESRRAVAYGACTEHRIVPLPLLSHTLHGDRSKFRMSIDVSENDMVFLYLGRLDPSKGLDFLLSAFGRNECSKLRAVLAVAGTGFRGFERRLQHQAQGLSSHTEVRWLGFLEGASKADAFAGADVFVLPSKKENFGVAVVEALAAGLPVLISDNVFIHEQIVPTAGWLCQYEVGSIARSIEHILQNPAEVRQRAGCAQAVAQQFMPDALVPQYRRLYELP